MARWTIPEVKPFRSPGGLHLVLALGMPGLTALLVTVAFTGQGPGLPGPLAAAYALALALWAPWTQRTHQSVLLRIWWWVMATLGYYGVSGLAFGAPWPHTFDLEGPQTVAFLLGFCQGQLSAFWAGQLAPRARLLQVLEGVPEGKDLEERVRDFQVDADFTQAHEGALTGSTLVLIAVGVLACVVGPQGTGWGARGLLAVLVIGGLTLGGFWKVCRRQMEALMYGRRLGPWDLARPVVWTLGLAVGAGVLAWGLLGLGGPWLSLNFLLPNPPGPPPAPEAPTPVQVPRAAPGLGDPLWALVAALLARIFVVDRLWALVQGLLLAASWALPVGAVVFLAAPLVKWLLSGGRETRGLGRRWWALLVDQLRAFLALLASWRAAAAGDPGAPLGPGALRAWAEALGRKPAAGGRRIYPEVVKAFLALARWGQPVAAYRTGETTREYLGRLGALVPLRAPELHRAADLIDEELFGPRGLGAEDRRHLAALVAETTLVPLSPPGPGGVS